MVSFARKIFVLGKLRQRKKAEFRAMKIIEIVSAEIGSGGRDRTADLGVMNPNQRLGFVLSNIKGHLYKDRLLLASG